MNADTPRHPHSSAYYAAAAFALSGVALIMAMPGLHVANELQRTHYAGFSSGDKQMAVYGGYIGIAVVLALCLSSVVIALVGTRVAGATGEPRGALLVRRRPCPVRGGCLGRLWTGLEQ